jgi:hypothetical protein
MKKTNSKRSVLITTERRGVFAGTLESYDEKARVAVLTDARMAIHWATTRGLFELAQVGPNERSKISAKADRVRLELCECVIDLSDAAKSAWDAVK